jgi:hypothetical protein
VIITELTRPDEKLRKTSTAGTRCREIEDADLDAIADLLTIGFPRRDRSYWVSALRYLQMRHVPEGFPRFGFMLVSRDRAVGVLLLIFSATLHGDDSVVRCNVSSWYAVPEFRGFAPLLVSRALRHKPATFVNTSPADNTLPIIEAQGFRRFSSGTYMAIPALTLRSSGARLIHFSDTSLPQDYLSASDTELLWDHHDRGCLSVILQERGDCSPLVFRRRLVKYRLRRAWLPCAQLIYARDVERVVRNAGLIGRYLAFRGSPVLLMGANEPVHRLSGKFFPNKSPMYYKGPDKPSPVDLAYTEAGLFGA